MKEPAIALPRRADFNDTPLAPIRLGKFAQFVYSINKLLQNSPIPAARLTRPPNAIVRMPLPPVCLPRHLRRAAHFRDLQIPFPLLLLCRRIICLPLGIGPSGKNWCESDSGMRDRRTF